MTEERKPLSLNERANRLLGDLSRSRGPKTARPHPPPPPPPEDGVPCKVPIEGRQRLCKFSLEEQPYHPPPSADVCMPRKVPIEGRRRLCKLSHDFPKDDSASDNQPWADESPKKQESEGGDEHIRDILNDLTSKLECLSVERPSKTREVPAIAAVPQPLADLDEEEEFGSAESTIDSRSPVTVAENGANEAESTSVLPWDDNEEDESVVTGAATVISSEGSVSSFASVDSPDRIREDERKGKEKAEELVSDDSSYVAAGSIDRTWETWEDEKIGQEKVELVSDDSETECIAVGSDDEDPTVGTTDKDPDPDSVVDVDENDDIDGFLGEGNERPLVLDGKYRGRSLKYTLAAKIANILYPHQREGLRWLWSLHCRDTGGILGDDMGLGKTMQISSFLAGLFQSQLIKRAMIVAPKTLLAHWTKELTVVGLSAKIKDYSGSCAKMRNYELSHAFKDGGVLLTTYDIVRNNFKHIRGDFYEETNEEVLWDYVVLDEGHIIKNPSTQRAKSLLEIPSFHRIIISGTPIQNNLKELWALFNFCCPEVFGDKDEFKHRYEHKILRGNERNASDREKYVGSSTAKELRERIKPFFLRRLKSEVFSEDKENLKLSKKTELVIWLKLSQCQRQMYEAFLNSELVHLAVGGSPLAALTILKKICDHPQLLTQRAAQEVLEGMDGMLNSEDIGMVERMVANIATTSQFEKVMNVDNSVSCKICFILPLLENLLLEGHSVLIFSQTRKMLNLIEEDIASKGYSYLRIDGTTKSSDREKIVNEFQAGKASIFLLTSKVGGLGLTLTIADRVIVVDPAWNPSTDSQSVDRAYRIGQTKDVIVYRLMTSGTIEEKIYKMQVFKGGLFKFATEKKEQTRYFSRRDLKELFSLPKEGFDVSLTQLQLQEEHGHQQKLEQSLLAHIKFLEGLDIAGVSHHNLLFSKTATVPVVQDEEVEKRTVPSMISRKGIPSTSEKIENLADYAFNPKQLRPEFRRYQIKSLPTVADKRGEIEEKMERLSQTLANTGVVMNLPDKGERIRRQLAELNLELREIHALTDKRKVVIDVDDLTAELEKGLHV